MAQSRYEQLLKERLEKAGFTNAEVEKNLTPNNDFPEDSNESSDSVEDETGDHFTPEYDAQILNTLGAIRAKSSAIYDPNAKFYGDTPTDDRASFTKHTPVTLRQYQVDRMLKGEDILEEEDTTFAQEQASLKNLKFEVSEDDASGDFLTIRDKKHAVNNGKHYRELVLDHIGSNEATKSSMSDRLGHKGTATGTLNKSSDEFLIGYILNKGWINKKEAEANSKDELDLEEDKVCLDVNDEFEAKKNFRFEQPGAETIHSFPRLIETSLRQEKKQRKVQRAASKARKAAEKLKQVEELKHLKNVKKNESLEKYAKCKEIQEIGKRLPAILEEDFDPETFDQQMHDLMQLEEEGDDDDIYSHKSLLKDIPEIDNDLGGKPDKKSRGSKASTRKLPEHAMDELYKLDYEDKVGNQIVRFKYRAVEPQAFGLTTEDILNADDNDLNSFVSLKKLAPYRPLDMLNHDVQKYAKKKRVYALRHKKSMSANKPAE